MELMLLSVLLFLVGTAAVAVAAGTGLIQGRKLFRHSADVEPVRINPGWISGGPIEAEEPRTAEPKLNNYTFKGVATVALLLLIKGAILAAAILFLIGAFTAGSGWAVFLSSFAVGFLTLVTLFFAAKTGVGVVKSFFGRSKPAHHHRTGFEAVKAAVLLYAAGALIFASFWLFVGGLVRIFI